MTTDLRKDTDPKQELTSEEKMEQLRELFTGAPEVGRRL